MGLGVETIGIHDFKPLGDGKVAVSLNNGNMGAFICDEAAAEKLKEKYRANSDKLELSTKDTNKPKMSYEEASLICLNAFNPFYNMLNPYSTIKIPEAMEALKYYREHGVTSKNS